MGPFWGRRDTHGAVWHYVTVVDGTPLAMCRTKMPSKMLKSDARPAQEGATCGQCTRLFRKELAAL